MKFAPKRLAQQQNGQRKKGPQQNGQRQSGRDKKRASSKWNKSFVIFFAASIYQIEKLKSCIYQIQVKK